MDLSDVTIESDEDELLREVDTSLARLRGIGAFTPEARERLLREFLPDRISDTLIIESIFVDARLTRAILDGQAVSEIDSHGEQAVLNVREASALIQQEADLGSSMSLALVREVNRRIQVETGESHSPGAFRQFNVKVTGAEFQPPDFATIPESMQEFIDQAAHSAEYHPVVIGAWAHWVVARIHPFQNGNGRTARLVQDFFLLKGGLLPVGIPSGRRREYYDALAWADEHDDLSPMIRLVADAQLAALQKAYEFGIDEVQARDNVRALAQRANASVTRHDQEAYQLWRDRADAMARTVRKLAEEFNVASDGIRINVQVYEPKSFEKWQEIIKNGWAQQTWYILMNFHRRGMKQFGVLFYFKRHRKEWIAGDSRDAHNAVAAFVHIAEKGEGAVGEPPKDPYISLREIVFMPSGYRVYTEGIGPAGSKLPRGITVVSDSPLWQGEDVASLAGTVTTLLSECVDKLGVE